MEKIKIIFFSILVFFSIAQILGNDFVRYIDNLNYTIEASCPPQDNKSLISSGSSVEEEPIIVCYSNSKEIIISLQECFSDIVCKLPVKIHYSIWLPPDNC